MTERRLHGNPLQGELDVVLGRARNLPVWGFPGQSNPYCRLILGEQAVQSRRDDDTSTPGRYRHPVWNQVRMCRCVYGECVSMCVCV